MKTCALACGDDERCRAGALDFRELNIAIGAERDCHAIDGVDRLGVQTFEISPGDGDAKSVCAAIEVVTHSFGWALGRDWIARVVTLHGVVSEREIAGCTGQWTDMVEAGHKWKSARAGEPAVGRFQSEHAAQRSRHPDRAVGVGRKRKRHEAAGDRRGRSARRSAAHAVEIMRIARRAVVGVLAGEVIGVFAHVERADEDSAGRFEALDQCCITGCWFRIAIDLRSGERCQPGDVEQIFHRERHTGERENRLAARERLIDGLGTNKRALLGDCGERIEQRVARPDARQRRFDNTQRAGTAGSDGRGDFAGRVPGKITHRRLKHGTPGLVRCRREAETDRLAPRA